MAKLNQFTTYQSAREHEVKEIRKLLAKGYVIEWGSHNWFYLGGKCFNGYTRKMVRKIKRYIPLGSDENESHPSFNRYYKKA